jgi:hypothetical protein
MYSDQWLHCGAVAFTTRTVLIFGVPWSVERGLFSNLSSCTGISYGQKQTGNMQIIVCEDDSGLSSIAAIIGYVAKLGRSDP